METKKEIYARDFRQGNVNLEVEAQRIIKEMEQGMMLQALRDTDKPVHELIYYIVGSVGDDIILNNKVTAMLMDAGYKVTQAIRCIHVSIHKPEDQKIKCPLSTMSSIGLEYEILHLRTGADEIRDIVAKLRKEWVHGGDSVKVQWPDDYVLKGLELLGFDIKHNDYIKYIS